MALVCLLLFWAASVHAESFPESAAGAHSPAALTPTGSRGCGLQGELNGVVGDFLLDTGASIVTVNRSMFEEIQKLGVPGGYADYNFSLSKSGFMFMITDTDLQDPAGLDPLDNDEPKFVISYSMDFEL